MEYRSEYLRAAILALLTCAMLFVAVRAAAEKGPIVNSHGLDISFIRSEPYSKQKLNVDLSNIATHAELNVVKDAINPVILFISRVSSDPPGGARTPLAMTARGRLELRRPPVDFKRSLPQRFSHIRDYDWQISNPTEIAVTVDFGRQIGKPKYSDRFVFVKQHDSWLFDRHAWESPKKEGK